MSKDVTRMESKMTSINPTVEFLDMKDQYAINEDLIVRYKLVDYSAREGDRLAIFHLGWTYVKDYVLFEWAPITDCKEEVGVKFTRHDLPRNSVDYFQICYIGSENELQGASAPFQFIVNIADSVSTMASSLEGEVRMPRKLNEHDKDRQINKLKEENAILKECLKSLVEQKKSQSQCKLEDINQLREITEKLYATLKFQQSEIEMLKKKLRDNDEIYLTKSIGDYDLGELKSMPPFPFAK